MFETLLLRKHPYLARYRLVLLALQTKGGCGVQPGQTFPGRCFRQNASKTIITNHYVTRVVTKFFFQNAARITCKPCRSISKQGSKGCPKFLEINKYSNHISPFNSWLENVTPPHVAFRVSGLSDLSYPTDRCVGSQCWNVFAILTSPWFRHRKHDLAMLVGTCDTRPRNFCTFRVGWGLGGVWWKNVEKVDSVKFSKLIS